ncbi:MAG: transposase [bacterium]|nr:transposase [bacterium]
MKRTDISAMLENIQPDLDEIDGNAQKDAVNTLLNIVEASLAEIEDLKKEQQSLKDEINRLKGEQGVPNIRGPKKADGNISSEKERLEAEKTDEAKKSQEGFKLDKNSLEKLKEHRLPVELLEQLEMIQGERYSNEAECIRDIEAVIDKEMTEQYRALLLKHARYRKRNRRAKLPEIRIDRQVDCPVDTGTLPTDAKFNGYEYKIVQDVIIHTDNVECTRETYFSPSLHKCYLGDVPAGYDQGDFGPNIRADIIVFTYVGGMTIPKIAELYRNIGTLISRSYISNHLIKSEAIDTFHHEKTHMHQAAIEVSDYVQVDDTGTRVNGQNHYTHIVCNDVYTAFFTTEHKNRLTISDVLRNFESRRFLLNDETLLFLEKLGLSLADRQLLSEYTRDTAYQEQQMLGILQIIYGTGSPRKRTRILEGCAMSCYRQETGISIVKILVCDDAPQFKLLTDELALCWIHEGRHYKRLNPIIPLHQQKLADFLQQFWAYYRKLAIYKTTPNLEQAEILRREFDTVFSTKTGYADLDTRIEKSKHKKHELLVVLDHPEVPLHNNLSENAARVEKRRKDASLQTKTDAGTKAKDTMMSIVETCKKLSISSYKLIHDRVKKIHKFPSLAEMIRAKAAGKPPPT